MSLPAEITRIPVSGASLPATYERAKAALSECASLDECCDWADKALALSSYARQAQDDTLEKLSMRIRARAIRRAGELLRTFQTSANGGRPKNGGGGPTVSQRRAAEAAGLSKDQEVQATAVARIPEEQFEEAVESESPPSVTKLAEMGRRPGFKQATQLLGELGRFARFCEQTDPEEVAGAVMEHEAAKAKEWVSAVDSWLDRFVINLGP